TPGSDSSPARSKAAVLEVTAAKTNVGNSSRGPPLLEPTAVRTVSPTIARPADPRAWRCAHPIAPSVSMRVLLGGRADSRYENEAGALQWVRRVNRAGSRMPAQPPNCE